tara:strand:- start:14606 stop:15106 length:501 start_codon:yes stop_codon:yes gene_type:complete
MGATIIALIAAVGIIVMIYLDQHEDYQKEIAILTSEADQLKESMVQSSHRNNELQKLLDTARNDPNVWALSALGNASAGRVMLWLMLSSGQGADIKIDKGSCDKILQQLGTMARMFAKEGPKKGLSEFQVKYGVAYFAYELRFAMNLCKVAVGNPHPVQALKKIFP